MTLQPAVQAFQNWIRGLGLKNPPSFHVVLGSGFGEALFENASWRERSELFFQEVPGLAATTTPDHKGNYRIFEHVKTGVSAVFQSGRLHGYEGHSAQKAVLPVMIPRLAGIQNFLLTNAAGGIINGCQPGHVMVIRDHINFTGQNPLIGENPAHGPRFPYMSEIYDAQWRNQLVQVLSPSLPVHTGVYLGLIGPSFETPAEIELFAKWGVGAVGMSTVWEAIALKHSGARIAALSLFEQFGLRIECIAA